MMVMRALRIRARSGASWLGAVMASDVVTSNPRILALRSAMMRTVTLAMVARRLALSSVAAMGALITERLATTATKPTPTRAPTAAWRLAAETVCVRSDSKGAMMGTRRWVMAATPTVALSAVVMAGGIRVKLAMMETEMRAMVVT